MNSSNRAADSTFPNGLQAVQPADDDLDLLAESGRKVTRITVVLMAAILAGVAFLGGAVVQKQWGSSSGSSTGFGGAESGFGGAAGGYGGGGFGGGTQGGQGAGTQGGQGAGTQAGTTATPVVVGTVAKVSGRKLTVKNFGGKSITVKVPKGTTVTNSSDSALSSLAKGASVSVVGTKAADGTVTATSITVS